MPEQFPQAASLAPAIPDDVTPDAFDRHILDGVLAEWWRLCELTVSRLTALTGQLSGQRTLLNQGLDAVT